MKKLHHFSELTAELSQDQTIALTLGNFDGVHRGHQKLIEVLRRESLDSEVLTVMTFDPHPWAFFNPTHSFVRLFSPQDQSEQFRTRGLALHVSQPFNETFSQLSPEQFLQDVFVSQKVSLVVVGHDFRFGRDRGGDLDVFQKFCLSKGIRFSIVPPVATAQGEIISSSRIRDFIRQGEVERAQEFLGRPFEVHGQVRKGAQKGTAFGFPTANLDSPMTLLPSGGVYISQTTVGQRVLPSITNVGTAPTVRDETSLKVETHILNFSETLYDQDMKVQFLKRVRPEIKFKSIEELRARIARDVQACKEYFSENS